MEKGLEYEYYDISEKEEYKAEFYKLREQFSEYSSIIENNTSFGIPAVFYDGNVVIGFNEEALDKLLATHS